MMVPKFFSFFWRLVLSCLAQIVLSLLYQSEFAFLLKLVQRGIVMIVTSICKLKMICRWSEPRFVFVSHLVEVIKEADANETAEGLGVAYFDSLLG